MSRDDIINKFIREHPNKVLDDATYDIFLTNNVKDDGDRTNDIFQKNFDDILYKRGYTFPVLPLDFNINSISSHTSWPRNPFYQPWAKKDKNKTIEDKKNIKAYVKKQFRKFHQDSQNNIIDDDNFRYQIIQKNLYVQYFSRKNQDEYQKYLKYKSKYLELKKKLNL